MHSYVILKGIWKVYQSNRVSKRHYNHDLYHGISLSDLTNVSEFSGYEQDYTVTCAMKHLIL